MVDIVLSDNSDFVLVSCETLEKAHDRLKEMKKTDKYLQEYYGWKTLPSYSVKINKNYFKELILKELKDTKINKTRLTSRGLWVYYGNKGNYMFYSYNNINGNEMHDKMFLETLKFDNKTFSE